MATSTLSTPPPATGLNSPRPRPRRRLSTGRLRWLGLLLPLLLLGAWQLCAVAGLFGANILPSPADTAHAFAELTRGGELGDALVVSLGRAVTGLAIGVLIGTLLGAACGATRLGAILLDPTLQALRSLPVLALVPLFIIWFGIGETSKILMIALATTFPIYVNVLAAVAGVDRRHLELARVLDLRPTTVLRRVHVPAALPSWFVGLRYSSGLALVILVISEQVDADAGLGYLMTEARTFYRVDVILAVILVYGVLGVLTDRLVARGERWSLRWT